MGKNKIIILIVLTVIGLAIGGVVCNKAVYTLEDETVKKNETALSELSVETIEKSIEILTAHIRIYNKQLEEDLDSEERFEIGEAITEAQKKQLERKDLDPEERFAIRQAITKAKNEIYELQQELERRRNTKR